MEIKKYVLLDEFCNNDIIKIKEGTLNYGKTIFEYIDEFDEKHNFVSNYERIKKTSDNILDFLEVGDLVGCYYEKKSSDGKTWVEMPIYYVNGISKTHYHLPVFSIEKDDKHIKAIYKRQENGDYKRYPCE